MKNKYLLTNTLMVRTAFIALLMFLTVSGLYAQTNFTPGGTWDDGRKSTNAGTIVHNNGVVQLVSIATVAGAEGARVMETSNLISTGTTWSRCYNVFFGCPGNDNIGADDQGDGLAYSLYLPQVAGCDMGTAGVTGGGGLGYNSTGCSRMFTIEFDTYSSAFDGTYGGGTVGNNDEIAIQVNGNADGTTANKLTAVNAGNLEDGLEHLVCINYTPSGTHPNYNALLEVTIDGVTMLSYNLGNTYSLEAFMDPLPVSGSSAPPYGNNSTFETGFMAQMWSSGKQGATNPATVTPDAATHIVPNLNSGTTLCPATVTISAATSGCSGDYTLTSLVSPPSGCTTTKVDFFDGATLLGTSLSTASPYSYSVASPSAGTHAYKATATFSGACGNQSSTATSTVVGGSSNQMQKTSTAPVIGDGVVDPIWTNAAYTASVRNFGFKNSGGTLSDADLGAKFTTLYDNNFLYILVDVTDDVRDVDNNVDIWQNDAVEIFIDINKDAGAGYGANDQHYLFRRDAGAQKEDNAHSMTAITYGVIEKGPTTGYYMEIKLSWATMGGSVPPVAGTSLGFEVMVDDADGSNRDDMVDWANSSFDTHANANKMGTLNFGCDPLPVDLLNFTAAKKNETVVLDWSTASEKNNNKFVVLRSSDGINWVAIGEVAGVGNTSSITNYTFTDADPLDGISYYKLLQVDHNGQTSLSKIVTILTDGHLVRVSPNPFDNVLSIKTNIQGSINISIHDVLGRVLYEASEEVKDGQVNIQPELASGAYIVSISAGEFIEHYRVIKR